MKRKSLKFIACAAIMAMTLSVTACGGSDDTAPAAETEETTDDAAEPEAEAETEPETEAEPEEEAAAPDAEAETEGEAETETENTDEASDADTEEYSNLESYYKDPTVKAALDGMFSALAEEGMSVSLDVKDNEFIVIIKLEDSSMVVEGMAEALSAALDAQAATFEEQVKQFDEVVGEAGACTVTMRYLDPDDNVLAEKSFQAK